MGRWRGSTGEEGGRGKEEKEEGREAGRREGREGEGICWTNVKLLPTRLRSSFSSSFTWNAVPVT